MTLDSGDAMVASAAVDVVGTAPISFTDSTGAQKSVPLSALKFSGSKPDVADDWATEFKPADKTTVLAVATARLAADELTPPPTRPPSPAIAVTAMQACPESNNIVVAVTVAANHDNNDASNSGSGTFVAGGSGRFPTRPSSAPQ